MQAMWVPLALVYFKLGAYYFLVAEQGYLQCLAFSKKIRAVEGTDSIHILEYSKELLGFFKYIGNGDFDEVVESVVPQDVEYDKMGW